MRSRASRRRSVRPSWRRSRPFAPGWTRALARLVRDLRERAPGRRSPLQREAPASAQRSFLCRRRRCSSSPPRRRRSGLRPRCTRHRRTADRRSRALRHPRDTCAWFQPSRAAGPRSSRRRTQILLRERSARGPARWSARRRSGPRRGSAPLAVGTPRDVLGDLERRFRRRDREHDGGGVRRPPRDREGARARLVRPVVQSARSACRA